MPAGHRLTHLKAIEHTNPLYGRLSGWGHRGYSGAAANRKPTLKAGDELVDSEAPFHLESSRAGSCDL